MKKVTVFLVIIMIVLSQTVYGMELYKGSKSEIDVTNISNGYIKVRYLDETNKKLKVIIEKDSIQYTYDLNNDGDYDTYPLQLGDGKYKVRVFENITDNKYVTKQTIYINVKLSEQLSPYLISSQLVEFSETSEAIKKAQELTEGLETNYEKFNAIYDYVISNIIYDTNKAKNVKSGYLPSIDDVFESNSGICFDYASLLAAMLRSVSLPTKLVTGYSSNVSTFHAWNEVYIDELGWVILDPTIASAAKQSNSQRVIDYTNKLIDSKYYDKKFEY